MVTTIYLIRHSKTSGINNCDGDTLQEKNENVGLSDEGRSIIENISKSNELKNIDVIYSSNYKRALYTAEYIAKENNIDILIDKRFGERKHGVSSFEQLPKDYELRQFSDDNFKVGDGECLKEVRKRMYDALQEILDKHNGKKIVILSHSTAIASLLKTWCEIIYPDSYKFEGDKFFDGTWIACETFKLTFEDKQLIDIENIRF